MAEEVDDLAFRPAAIISIGLGEKRTMAAMPGFKQGNVRVAGNLRSGFRQEPDEWIVRCMDHQSRQRDLVDDARRGRACVIVLRSCKAAVTRRNDVVKFANAGGKALDFLISIG